MNFQFPIFNFQFGKIPHAKPQRRQENKYPQIPQIFTDWIKGDSRFRGNDMEGRFQSHP